MLLVFEGANCTRYMHTSAGEAMQVLRISIERGGTIGIQAELVDPSDYHRSFPDSYPADQPPRRFLEDVAEYIRAWYNLALDPRCPRRITYVINTSSWIYGQA